MIMRPRTVIKNHFCKICGGTTKYFDSASMLGKYEVKYFLCTECGFLQTEEPFWFEEAYSEAITASDTGLVGRNLHYSRFTKNVILNCFNPKGQFIDFGGGYGLLVRLMRDEGFDFWRHDPYCKNLFSIGYDAKPGMQFDLLTAFEVFEHLPDPLRSFDEMLAFSRNILFSTTLTSEPPRPLGSWDYYGLEHGQHISFYSYRSLQKLAEKKNLRLYSRGTVHLFSEKRIHPLLVRVIFNPRFRWMERLTARLMPQLSILSGKYTRG